jgi:hypothetical protein
MNLQHSAWVQCALIAVMASVMPVAPLLAQDAPPKINFWLNPDARYVTWETRNEATGETTSKGHQFYVPFGGQTSMRFADDFKIKLLARSGYVSTKNENIFPNVLDPASPFIFSGDLAHLTDTSVTGTLSINAIPGIQPYVSFGANLPTGQTIISGPQRTAIRVDSDIVQIASYGQGLNLAPTVGANIPITRDWLVNLSFGYNNRGKFDRIRVGPGGEKITEIDPSDTRTAAAVLSYGKGPLYVSITGSYTTENAATFKGDTIVHPYFQSGHSYMAGVSIDYTWDKNWQFSTSVSYAQSHRNLNPSEFVEDLLVTEDFNSNNSVTRVTFDPTYTEDKWSFGPSIGFTYRDKNSWSSETENFVPAKTIWSLGGAARYTVSDNLGLSARIERSWIDERRSRDVDPLGTDIWLFTFGGTVSF